MSTMQHLALITACASLLGCGVAGAATVDAVPTDFVDQVAKEWLAATQAPSVSLAIVLHGKLVFTRAYGDARTDPRVHASVDSRYAIDSVSKEFTAAAVLTLVEDGKVGLDEPLQRWFADLGEASAVTVRQLLNHTSGIRDFWPQDFVTPEMSQPVTLPAMITEWVKRPLDFSPGSEWQYSNTGFVLAGAVVARASGMSLSDYLQGRIFAPLHMIGVVDHLRTDPSVDAVGYTRHGAGPVRPAPLEQAGWLDGAASLAMRPADLARWDVSLMARNLLRPSSYEAMFLPVALANGVREPYGLGLDVERRDERLEIGHAGSGSGFMAENRVWPEERAAIVVLTNSDWIEPADLLDQIGFLILSPSPEAARARHVFEALQNGLPVRGDFTAVGNSYLTAGVIEDLHASLSPAGPLRQIKLTGEERRGGMITRRWRLTCARARFDATERGYPAGKLDEFRITPP